MILSSLTPTRSWHSPGLAAVVGAVLIVSVTRTCVASGGGGGHAAPSGGHAAPSSGHAAPGGGIDAEEDYSIESPTGYRGIPLGKFSIRTYRSVSGQKNRVRFKLYARVKNEDIQDFLDLLKNRKHKVRDQVIIATRLVPVEDYDDPELTKLRRRIQLRLHRTLPEFSIDDIYVSQFTLLVETQ